MAYVINDSCNTSDNSCYIPLKVIYPDFLVNSCDPNYVEEVMCEYAQLIFQNVLTEKNGIQICCPIDDFQAKLKFELLKLDLVDYTSSYCAAS